MVSRISEPSTLGLINASTILMGNVGNQPMAHRVVHPPLERIDEKKDAAFSASVFLPGVKICETVSVSQV